MAEIAPLRPLAYDPGTLARRVAPPYDVVDAAMRAELAARDPHNVVHVDLPEGDGDARYQRAGALFEAWQREGVLARSHEPALYRYTQTFEPPGGGARLARRGFFAAVRAVPLAARVILPHERTLSGPKVDRFKLSHATRAALSPQFMLYSDPERALDADLDAAEAWAAFETDDGVEHAIARVTDRGAIARVVAFLADRSLLIADGHHRYETAVSLAEALDREAREAGAAPLARGEHLFTPALLANGDDPGLVVFPTHRLVHSLPHFDFDELCARAAELFDVTPVSGVAELCDRVRDVGAPAFGALARGGRAVLLAPRADVDLARHPVLGARPEVLRHTAVALLHDGLVEHVLGVTHEAQAAKTNLRYEQDAHEAARALERGEGQVLFVMNGTPVATIRAVAEAGEVMPQKSTFFYPKVPTGLLFHTLHVDRPA